MVYKTKKEQTIGEFLANHPQWTNGYYWVL